MSHATTAAAPPVATRIAAPPRYRQALLVWIAIYPTITLLLELGGPLINDWPLPLRTLALTGVAVPTMVYVLLPALQRVFAGWLRR